MLVVGQRGTGEGALRDKPVFAKRPLTPSCLFERLCMPSPARGEGKISHSGRRCIETVNRPKAAGPTVLEPVRHSGKAIPLPS